MKHKILVLLGMIGLLNHANADVEKANSLTREESEKISEALLTLKESNVLIKDSSDKINLDNDVIQKLKVEGYLKKKRSGLQTICGGTGGHQ